MSSQNTHPQDSTAEPLLSAPQFSQCAWCLRRLGEQSAPIGEPMPDLSPQASHGICTSCAGIHFPEQVARLRAE